MITIPNLRSFWYHLLYSPPFRVRSGEVALNCPVLLPVEDYADQGLRVVAFCAALGGVLLFGNTHISEYNMAMKH